jgi:hypothetical protein
VSYFAAGEAPSATKFEALVPKIVSKVADETVNNSSAMQNDNELCHRRRRVEEVPAPVPDHLQLQLDRGHEVPVHLPGRLTATYSLLCVGSGLATWAVYEQYETGVGIVEGAGADRSIIINGTVAVGGTAGTLQLQWAQKHREPEQHRGQGRVLPWNWSRSSRSEPEGDPLPISANRPPLTAPSTIPAQLQVFIDEARRRFALPATHVGAKGDLGHSSGYQPVP